MNYLTGLFNIYIFSNWRFWEKKMDRAKSDRKSDISFISEYVFC